MKLFKTLSMALILILIFVGASQAATYYVTQTGTGDGTSYAAASSVAELNANTHFTPAGDDTIYFCDTITSQVVPPTSGTAGHVITYRGDYAGHAGVITGVNFGNSSSGAFKIYNKNYITVMALTVTLTTANGPSYGTGAYEGHGFYLQNAQYITLDGVTSTWNKHNGVWAFGGSANYIIQNSTISFNYASGFLASDGAGAGTLRYNIADQNGQEVSNRCAPSDTGRSFHHAIYATEDTTGEMLYYNNILSNTRCGHGLKMKSTATAYNNWIEGNSCSNVYLVQKGGYASTKKLYNNVIINPVVNQHGWSSNITWYDEDAGASTQTIYVYNNTLYSTNGHGIISVYQDGLPPTNWYIKNNIIYIGSASGWAFYFDNSGIPTGIIDIDYNLIYDTNATPFYWGTSHEYTLAQWNALSFVGTDIAGNPLFNSIPSKQFWLQATSPAKDAGTNLASVGVVNDYASTPRPQGIAYDIGAYEYGLPYITGVSITGGTF